MQKLASTRCNDRHLPGIRFPRRLRICLALEEALESAQDLLLAVPSCGFGTTLRRLAPKLNANTRLAWATKGLEPESGKPLHKLVAERVAESLPTAVISGPSFAREVAQGLPTALVVASSFSDFARDLASALHNDNVRAYTSDDITGVELGGAVKNVLAIAAGISDGLGFGANARAGLVTRGLAELIRLGTALGGRKETLMGLAGVGDLVLTCTDNQSRNRRLGLALGHGQAVHSALSEIGQAIEGVQTAREIMRLATAMGVEMPISEQVYRVLYEGLSPQEAVRALLSREPKPEHP
jgi:Glycerol-3-phosphate dehydrogenase